MNKNVSVYLDTVCTQIKSKQICLPMRAELSSHIHSLTDELKQAGLDEDELSENAAIEELSQEILYKLSEFMDTSFIEGVFFNSFYIA
jgi:flagellar basal body-associated protein FliL